MSFGFGSFFTILVGFFDSLILMQAKNTQIEILNITTAMAPAAIVIPMMAGRDNARVLF